MCGVNNGLIGGHTIYPYLADCERHLCYRPLSDRFKAIAHYGGSKLAEDKWLGGCKHTACKVTIRYNFGMSVYILGHSLQTEIVRFYELIIAGGRKAVSIYPRN